MSMFKYIKSNNTDYTDLDWQHNQIQIVMYLEPIIYANSEIYCTAKFNKTTGKYETDNNPTRIINEPLSAKGEELEAPISAEWESFIADCKWLVSECGFTLVEDKLSTDSKKSHYFLIYGLKGRTCGSIVFDLRISEHSIEELKFPEEAKQILLKQLQVDNVLSGEATEAGIDFVIEQVLVGSVKNDTWDRAFNRVADKLKRMKSKVIQRLNS